MTATDRIPPLRRQVDAQWLAELNAQIADGRMATEAESAEILSWLLKLEPAQRWCLLLRRAPCLKRLVDGDYQRILTLMVELESAALMSAPSPPEPCIDPAVEPLPHHADVAKPLLPLGLSSRLFSVGAQAQTAFDADLRTLAEQMSRVRAQAKFWIALTLILAGSTAAGIWLFSRHEAHPLAAMVQEVGSLWGTTESPQDASKDRVGRQRQSLLAFLAWTELSRKLQTGQPFVDELEAFKAAGTDSAQVTTLAALAAQGVPASSVLLIELSQLNEGLDAHYQRLLAQRGYRPWSYPLAGELQQLKALRQSAASGLAQAQQGDWRAAIERLREVELSGYRESYREGYRDWCERARRWATAEQAMIDLRQRVWSELTNAATVQTAHSADPPR